MRRPGIAAYFHLLGLASIAIARPLFELLAEGSDFFAARGGDVRDVILVLVLALVAAPLPWLAIAFLARGRGAAGARVVAGLVGSLAGLVALRAAALAALSPASAIGLSLLVGAAAGWCYQRTEGARLVASCLVPAVVVVPALFLLDPGIARSLEPPPRTIPLHASGGRMPVFVLILDELPLVALLDESGGIDAGRFPHFAALAAESTWFRRAVAPAPETVTALPAILSGRVGQAGDRLQRERNLFTLLGDYPTYAIEPVTGVCPRPHNLLIAGRRPAFGERARRLAADLPVVWAHLLAPPRWRSHLPSLAGGWEGFTAGQAPARAGRGRAGFLGRRGDLERLLAAVDGRQRSLYMAHVLLPHPPWEYLPSGRTYPYAPDFNLGDFEAERWRLAHAYQRYALQLGYVDRLVGEIVERLRQVGIYEPALVMVLADHGLAFQPGKLRRSTEATTLAEVLGVPLFVKLPGQRRGGVVDEPVSTADLPATVADVLRVRAPWPLPGRSLVARGPRPAPLYLGSDKKLARFDGDLAELTLAARARLVDLVGVEGLRDPFRIGPWPGLRGMPAAPRVLGTDAVEAEVDHPERWRDVGAQPDHPPLLVTGKLTGAAPGDDCCSLAVAVGGTVWATTHSFWTAAGEHRFGTLLPEESLRAGVNEIALYRVDARGEWLRVIRRRRRGKRRPRAPAARPRPGDRGCAPEGWR